MRQQRKKVSELNVIRALQGDFPLVEEPYKELAARAGVSEEVFLARVKEMTEQKMIRKMGAVLRHREVGFSANVLCAWAVPPERLDDAPVQVRRELAIAGRTGRHDLPARHIVHEGGVLTEF